jgi:hypothetical protein
VDEICLEVVHPVNPLAEFAIVGAVEWNAPDSTLTIHREPHAEHLARIHPFADIERDLALILALVV